MKPILSMGPVRRVAAAIDGFVKSFTPKDPGLYADRMAERGVGLSRRSVLELDAAWACVRLISETIATLPLSMYERTAKGKRLASSHPLQMVIHDQPNTDSTAAVFWEAFVASMLMGAGRAEKLMGNGKVIGLAFLDPDKLRISTLANGRKRYEYPRPDGTLREIPVANIWTVPGFTLDGMNGVSVIQYGAKVFQASIDAENAARRSFRNGTMQAIYYTAKNWFKPVQRTEFKTSVAGSVERGEAPLLEGGTDVKAVGIDPIDAQLLESRSFGVESICRWFRVPPWMVGHTEKSTSWGSGIEQQMIGFLTFTLSPWLKRIEQAIVKDLLTPGERVRFYPKFAVEGLLRADSAGRAAFYAAMVNNGILTRDEVRELEDREPMGGNAAVLTVQSAMTTLDSVGAAQSPTNEARAAMRAFLGFDELPKETR